METSRLKPRQGSHSSSWGEEPGHRRRRAGSNPFGRWTLFNRSRQYDVEDPYENYSPSNSSSSASLSTSTTRSSSCSSHYKRNSAEPRALQGRETRSEIRHIGDGSKDYDSTRRLYPRQVDRAGQAFQGAPPTSSKPGPQIVVSGVQDWTTNTSYPAQAIPYAPMGTAETAFTAYPSGALPQHGPQQIHGQKATNIGPASSVQMVLQSGQLSQLPSQALYLQSAPYAVNPVYSYHPFPTGSYDWVQSPRGPMPIPQPQQAISNTGYPSGPTYPLGPQNSAAVLVDDRRYEGRTPPIDATLQKWETQVLLGIIHIPDVSPTRRGKPDAPPLSQADALIKARNSLGSPSSSRRRAGRFGVRKLSSHAYQLDPSIKCPKPIHPPMR